MRRALLTLAVLLGAASALSACGSIDNAPLRVGNVRGRLTQSDPSLAVVAVVGNPDVSTTVGPDGHFELAGVPVGEAELFVLASAESAVRIPVHVDGARTSEVGEVAPRPGGFLQLEIAAPGGQAVSKASVSVEGTPLRKLKVEKTGRARVGPLPEGCYAVEVVAAGFPARASQSCVGPGEQKLVRVELQDDPTYAERGCQYSGCVEGAVCAADGSCVQCSEDAHCAAGLSCKKGRCEGPGAVCAACDGDWQCASRSVCAPMPEGGAACAVTCTAQSGCMQAGFGCQDGLCLPDGTRGASSCQGVQAQGSSCSEDAECRARGLPQGVCDQGACTSACSGDDQCPDGLTCSGPGVCQRPG